MYGDNVEFDENKKVIDTVLERSSFMKRPKVSNISQIIFVISSKMPKPNLLMLDKWLVFAEFSKIKPIIVINKIDLDKNETERLSKLYTEVGYKVIQTSALKEEGIEQLKEVLKSNTSALARTVRGSESQVLLTSCLEEMKLMKEK